MACGGFSVRNGPIYIESSQLVYIARLARQGVEMFTTQCCPKMTFSGEWVHSKSKQDLKGHESNHAMNDYAILLSMVPCRHDQCANNVDAQPLGGFLSFQGSL